MESTILQTRSTERVDSTSTTAVLRVPREPLAHLPTPLVKVRAGWPHGNLFIKHDDLTGTALSGNKVRKLEYLIADARAAGADTLLTWGGVQSNSARALAVAAAMTGFRSVLVLAGDEPTEDDGNLLLARLAGAELVFAPGADPAAGGAAVEDTLCRLRREGARPYLVPFGGSSPVGVLGYVRAAHELAPQLAAIGAGVRTLLVPMASGGTYAGLYVGLQMLQLPIALVGAFVLGTSEAWVPRLVEMVRGASERFGFGVALEPRDVRLLDARGAGYGRPTLEEAAFIADFGRRTGVLLDPVYTGKALYACDQAVRRGDRRLCGDLLFVHTGGTFGLFPHRRLFRRATGRRSARRSEVPISHPRSFAT